MTPEQQAELPSLQYVVVCGPAFERNTADHAAMVEKLDLIIERQTEAKADLAITKKTANEVYNCLIMGNGDSIVTQVRLHGEDITHLKSSLKRANNRGWAMIQGVILAAVGGAVALFVNWILRGPK